MIDIKILKHTLDTNKLKPNYDKVLRMRYDLDNRGFTYTLKQIGEDMGISKQRVLQIELSAIAKVKEIYGNSDWVVLIE